MTVDSTTASELNAEQVQRILVQPLEAESRSSQPVPGIFETANRYTVAERFT